MKTKTWADKRAEEIRKDAIADYGRGWARLSEEQQNHYLMTKVLYLVLSQFAPEFKPAQDMARDVMRALNPEDQP